MGDVNQFYNYLATIRTEYSDYIANTSNEFAARGMESPSQQIKLVLMNMFTACLQVLNSFDPSSINHVFTASEMDDFKNKINYIIDKQYNIDFTQYY